jgi:hypothetical protein
MAKRFLEIGCDCGRVTKFDLRLSTVCPTCAAGPGQMCHDLRAKTGGNRLTPHLTRR